MNESVKAARALRAARDELAATPRWRWMKRRRIRGEIVAIKYFGFALLYGAGPRKLTKDR